MKETKIADKIMLYEMANAIPKYTGINGVSLYFSTKEEMPNAQAHALGRVKLIKKGVEIGFLSIKKNKDALYVADGFKEDDKKYLKKLIKFMDKNSDILWKYWNTPSLKADSATTMQNFNKI